MYYVDGIIHFNGCVSLICYSCNYYMKLHAREIGMLKLQDLIKVK
ncbi:hypothetical protein [Faecalibacillus intestinalis]